MPNHKTSKLYYSTVTSSNNAINKSLTMIMTTTFQHGLDPDTSHSYIHHMVRDINNVLRSVEMTDMRQDILFR